MRYTQGPKPTPIPERPGVGALERFVEQVTSLVPAFQSLRVAMARMATRQYPGEPTALQHLAATQTLSRALTEARVDLRRSVAYGRLRAEADVDAHLAAWSRQVLGR